MRQNDAPPLFSMMETNQAKDKFVHGPLSRVVDVRLLSLRCHEAKNQSLPNQDYARIIYRRDDTSLCFCVCDGVGSSYKGDFAAHYLATHLVHWLHNLPDLQAGPLKLGRSLQDYLDLLAAPAQAKLATLPFPEDVPPLVQEVLTDLLANYGSETVFLCGRLDYGNAVENQPAQSFLHGSDDYVGQAFFGWMGNVSGQLFTAPGHSIPLGDPTDRGGRWSTLHGCRGAIRVWGRPLRGLDRLLIYTDGFGAHGSPLLSAMDNEWTTQVRRLLASPAEDDITALALHWQSAAQ